MSDKIEVVQGISQRNRHDVAVELTKLYADNIMLSELEDIENAYAKFYALANILEQSNTNSLNEFLSEEILNKLNLK
ncbi:hypothetical protein KHA96_18370 [Bacillus sp. FJAT-49711]|uniref:hypothetical protein n=1 Tax=Bacillus sp. FJAT-49711 TaxID=2833585 RepID=UPI001BC95706|nr:hypothetical protein [Bacillus sp. FJAT-49711]MBS4220270.1 hypothetical protein [Bacillus sp. FJAT-49711]